MRGDIKISPDSDRHDAVKRLLLDMISGATTPDLALIADLSPLEWDAVLRLAGQHRLMPLLHHRLRGAGAGWPVPVLVRKAWQEAYCNAALRSLSASALLSRLHCVFEGAGLPYAALKGAFLAWHAWPDPALRPLRDIDVLVPREQAIEAQALLLANGFATLPGGNPTDVAIEHHKPLAPVEDRKTGLCVEIHLALVDPGKLSTPQGCAHFSSAALGRRRTFGGEPAIRFLDPTDALLHLIVHAALDHSFDNGPLVLGDVARLIQRHPPDWPVFWQRASELGAERASMLVLGLAERYEGPIAIHRPSDVALPPPVVVDAAALMTLGDFERRQAMAFGVRLASAGWRQRLSLAAHHATPHRHVVEKFATAGGGRTRIGIAYLRWAADRARDYARSAFSPGIADEVRAAAWVSSWLAGEI